MSDISYNLQENSNNNHFDLATITLLSNVNCRAKLDTMSSLQNIKKKQHQTLRHDIRFYRKRIMSGFKDILTRKENRIISSRTISAFDVFVASLIEDFKVVDTRDIIQAELNDIDIETSEDNNDYNFNTNSNLVSNINNEKDKIINLDNKQDELNDKNGKEINDNQKDNKIMMIANKYLQNTKVIPVTLDKFLVKKPIDNPAIWDVKSHAIKQKDKHRPELKVNLRDTSLRTKGIVEKENITKKYEKEYELSSKNETKEDDERNRRKKIKQNIKKKNKE